LADLASLADFALLLTLLTLTLPSSTSPDVVLPVGGGAGAVVVEDGLLDLGLLQLLLEPQLD
jgi:hypothetical protein